MTKEIIEMDLPKVNEVCALVLGGIYTRITRLGGLTNHTYHVTMEDESQFVVRIPASINCLI